VTRRDTWLDLVDRIPGVARTRTALVLGDANAQVCRMLTAAGWTVSCCPDAQIGRGEVHHADPRFSRIADVVQSAEPVGLVVATEGSKRLIDTNPSTVVADLFAWARRNATAAVVEAPRRALAPDLHDLGPFDVLGLLGGFRFLAEVSDTDPATAPRSPVVLASERLLLVGDEWIGADDVERLDADPVDGSLRPARTFRVPGGRIVKVECTSEDYFERTQLLGEAAFLDGADARVRESLGLPTLLSLRRGRAVTTLVREDLVGGLPPEVDQQLAAIVDVASRYAALGLFHNDFRPWNLLWDGDRAALLDFSDTSAHDDDVRDLPQVLALAGTLAAIATDEIRWGDWFHVDLLDLVDRCGLLDAGPSDRLFGDPWLRLPTRRDRIAVHSGMSAEQIVRTVLEATGE
jgi:hypothetical protein